MLKRVLVSLLVLVFSAVHVFAQTSVNNPIVQDRPSMVRATVEKVGVNGRIKRLVLNDGTKLKGFIKEINSDSFVLVDGYRVVGGRVEAVDKSNSAREIRFDEIREIRPFKGNKGGAIAVGVIVAAAGGGLLYLLGRSVSN